MSATELDLEKGDPDYEGSSPMENLTPAQRRRRERAARASDSSSRGSDGSGGSGSSKGGSKGSARDLVTRLDEAFAKIADQREARGDQELADAIREDRHAISVGLNSLTGTFKPLRVLTLWVLGFLEPVLACWHVGGILVRRWFERRQRKYDEREAAEQQSQAPLMDDLQEQYPAGS